MNNLISVIVPVYNVENYVSECIKSIMDQTIDNYEVIIIDDGSTDNSLEICNQIIAENNKFKIFSQENRGISVARNNGLKYASGDFICFVDSDDIISRDYLEKLYTAINIFSCDISICNFQNFEVLSKLTIDNSSYKQEPYIITNLEAQKKIYSDDYIRMAVLWGKMFKKNILGNIKFPEGKINEDEFVIHLLYNNANRILMLEENLYFYRIRNGSIMTTPNYKKKLNSIQILELRKNFYIDNGDQELLFLNDSRYCNALFGFLNLYKYNSTVSDEILLDIHKKIKENYKKFLKNPKITKYRKIMVYNYVHHKKIYNILYFLLKIFRR